MTLYSRITLAAILLLAAAARYYALDTLIAGVFEDEVLNATEGIHAISSGDLKLFYPENNGREGVFINLVGLSVKMFGPTVIGVRFWSGIIGTLAVFFIFCLGREWFSLRTGLIAAFLLATNYWHLTFSRISFRAILVPTLMLGAFFGLARAWKSDTKHPALWAAFGGVCLGLGAHSYIAFRIVPAVVVSYLALEGIRRRRLPVRICAIWLGVAALIALPMAIHFVQHPHDFSRRTEQVSILALKEPLKAAASNFVMYLQMFHIKGDCNPRHNLVIDEYCQPHMNPAAGLLLLLGVGFAIAALWMGRRSPYFSAAGTLLVWIPVMLLPGVLSNETGVHALRVIGAVPAVILLAAWAADRIASRFPHVLLRSALYLVLAGAAWMELDRYFNVWPDSAGIPIAFSYRAADVARYSNSLPPEVPRFVISHSYAMKVPLYPGANPEQRLPIQFQPVVYFTMGHTQPRFITEDECLTMEFPSGSVLLPLQYESGNLVQSLRDRNIAFERENVGHAVILRIL